MFGVMQDITELRRAEDELRASEARFRTFVDHATDAFFLWDGQYLDVNRQACESLGYSREELIGKQPRDFDVGMDDATIARLGERVAAGEVVTFESLHRRNDGSVFPVEVRARQFRQGERNCRLALVRDITDRKRVENELRRSEAYLAEAQRLSHTGSFGWNVATGEIFWSEETYRIYELEREKPPTLEFIIERTHPDDRADVQATIARAQRDGRDFELEQRLLMPDGSVKHLHVVAHPVANQADQREFVGAVMDVTAQKRSEEERRAHVRFLESMDRINHAMQGTSDLEQMLGDVLDTVLAIFECDRALIGVHFGQPEATTSTFLAIRERREFAGRVVPGVEYPVDDALRVIPRVTRAANGPVQLTPESDTPLPASIVERFGTRSILTMPVRPNLAEPDRSYHFSLGQCSHPRVWTPEEVRLFDEIGRRLGDALTTLLTRRRVEEERERVRVAQEELARISRVTTMGEFAASLAHEIKQPIVAAIANADACVAWLERKRPDLKEASGAATRLANDARRASEIIDRVRALYKKDTARHERVDVNEIIRETMGMLRREASRSRVSMTATLAADVPSLQGDRVQLQQVFMNLILNGIEAMKERPGALTVDSRQDPGGKLLVTIADEGIGLPDGKADEIFGAFFTTKPHGTGMGLTISRSIVEAHGGRLWATSGEARGAVFHVSLPAAASPLARRGEGPVDRGSGT